MKFEQECPVCGSSEIQIKPGHSFIAAPYGPSVSYEDNVSECDACGSIVSLSKFLDHTDQKALQESAKESYDSMLSYLKENGISSAYIERALELPQRTVSRWKFTGELSAISVALLRIVRTYPWILKVAERKFDPLVANKEMLKNAVEKMFSSVKSGESYDLSEARYEMQQLQGQRQECLITLKGVGRLEDTDRSKDLDISSSVEALVEA